MLTKISVASLVRSPRRELVILIGWTLALAGLAGLLSRPRARPSVRFGVDRALEAIPNPRSADAS